MIADSADPLPQERLQALQQHFSHIAIVRSDVQREFFPTHDSYLSELECIKRADIVKKEIEELGIAATVVVADDHLASNLRDLAPDMCINFTDSVRGNMPASAGIPTIFNLLGIPFVGSNTLALSINCNKYLTKTLLEAWEIPTPQYQLFHEADQELEYEIRYPVILKLNEEHGSVGISEDSVVTNEDELRARLEYLINTYHQNVLCEEFIEGGRELTALVYEGENIRPKVMISERVYEVPHKRFKLVSFELNYADEYGIPYEWRHDKFVDKSGDIKEDVRKAFEVLRMDDYARFDIMLDKYGNHFIIDANSNPAFGPEEAVATVAKVNGKSFKKLLVQVLERNIPAHKLVV